MKQTSSRATAAGAQAQRPEVDPAERAGQSARLRAAIADDLARLYRVLWYVGDAEDGPDDDLIEHLAVLAQSTRDEVPAGSERAWLLKTLLRLVGAAFDGPQADLPILAVPAGRDGELSDADFERLHDALQELEKPERATVVLVVQEGLTLDQGSRIQGGTRSDFARRYVEAMAALEDEHVDALLGRTSAAVR